ncbi:hypothetical protein [Streptomyces sp. NRRL S-31]|uniref:hypothetical protein n=1 Tax=Streptomyces sp. NRRL S-31 TaxID=1463898 RepID=UPI0004CA87D0|nr:hypothetical protein [Streptomyces sp. NRRL S-31]
MSPDEDFEKRLAGALRGATGAFPPHSADLVRRSVGRGRRMRLFAAARTAAAAVAVVAAGGGLVALGALGGQDDGTPGRLPAGSPAVAAGQPSARTPAPVGGAEMVRILKGLLPPGGTVFDASGRGPGEGEGAGSPMARLTYSTARGSTGVDVTLTRLDPSVPADRQGQGGCLPVEVRPYDRCTTRKLPGGAELTTTKSYTYPDSDSGQRRWYAVFTTAGGAQVAVQEFGGGGEKEASGGADPLLSMDRLTSIARSPRWNAALAALPAPPSAPATGGGRTSGAALTRVLKAHLPRGGTVSDLNAGDGLVQLVYDDGHGRSMVEADVQYDMTAVLAGHMGCAGVPGDCAARTLADGTRVKEVRGRSEKGGPAEVWLVDVLYPDGRRVAVRSVDSYAESGPVTRPRPVLDLDGLRATALDRRFFTR